MPYKSILWLIQTDKKRFMCCATIPTATYLKRKYLKGKILYLYDTTAALLNRTEDLEQ